MRGGRFIIYISRKNKKHLIVCGKLITFARKMEKMEQIRVLGYKYIIGIVTVVASLVLTACGGKGDRLQGDIP